MSIISSQTLSYLDNYQYETDKLSNLLHSDTEISTEELFTMLDEHFNLYELHPSNEGLIRNILQIFIRIFMNFKTTLTRFYKTVKRGELEEYMDSHKLDVKAVNSGSISALINVKVNTFGFKQDPTLMNKWFLNNFHILNILHNSKECFKLISLISKNMENTTPENEVIPDINALQIISNKKSCEKIIKDIIKLVDLRPDNVETPFGSYFNRMKDFSELTKIVSKTSTKLYNDTSSAAKFMRKADTRLDKLYSKLEKLDTYIIKNKKMVKMFSETLRDYGLMLETIGTVSREYNAMDHWCVMVYKALNSHV